MPQPVWHRAVYLDHVQESPLTRRFRFRLPDLEDYRFTAGQFVQMELPIHEDPRKCRRSYSIASWPDGGNVLEFAIVRLEGGAGTRWLFDHARPGDEIRISDPLGRMVLHEPMDYDVVYIATGTGVAPFRSQLRDLVLHPRPHRALHLVFGTRTRADLLYEPEFRALEGQLEGFRYHPTLSREALPGYRHGYVHAVYEELIEGRHGAEDLLFFLCGWGDMIRDARKNLMDLGFHRKQIHFESYG